MKDVALLTAGRWDDLVEQFWTGALPDLPDDGSQFLVDVVDVA